MNQAPIPGTGLDQSNGWQGHPQIQPPSHGTESKIGAFSDLLMTGAK